MTLDPKLVQIYQGMQDSSVTAVIRFILSHPYDNSFQCFPFLCVELLPDSVGVDTNQSKPLYGWVSVEVVGGQVHLLQSESLRGWPCKNFGYNYCSVALRH